MARLTKFDEINKRYILLEDVSVEKASNVLGLTEDMVERFSISMGELCEWFELQLKRSTKREQLLGEELDKIGEELLEVKAELEDAQEYSSQLESYFGFYDDGGVGLSENITPA